MGVMETQSEGGKIAQLNIPAALKKVVTEKSFPASMVDAVSLLRLESINKQTMLEHVNAARGRLQEQLGVTIR